MNNNVSWKWLVGIMTGILVIGGGSWMSNMQAQVSDIRGRQQADSMAQSSDIAVIKEKLRVIEENQKEQREEAKEVNKKLDEVIRTLRRPPQ